MGSKNSRKKILITGALGHIGSQLIRDLDNSAVEEIIMMDNLESQRYSSLFHLPEHVRYRFIEDDIRTAPLSIYLKGVDVVIHLAALTNAEGSFDHVQEVESVNFHGLQRIAEACLEQEVKLFFPSSTSVYGSQMANVDELSEDLHPQSPYAETKLASEKYLHTLSAQGLHYCICRFGTIFGPSVGMRFHTAVNKFIWQAVNKQPITVWKTAWDQKRPYLDLGDCIAAINFIIKNNLFQGEVYNVLTSNFTVRHIVESIKEFIPQLEVVYVDSPIMNQLSYEVDNQKLRQMGCVPTGDLSKGIGNTINQLKGIVTI